METKKVEEDRHVVFSLRVWHRGLQAVYASKLHHDDTKITLLKELYLLSTMKIQQGRLGQHFQSSAEPSWVAVSTTIPVIAQAIYYMTVLTLPSFKIGRLEEMHACYVLLVDSDAPLHAGALLQKKQLSK